MAEFLSADLGRLFVAVENSLEQNRQALNQADPLNGNHGDHMVAIFQAATQAVQEQLDLELPQAMQAAALRLAKLADNDSARLYAVGLRQMALQFQAYNVSTNDLVAYVRSALADKQAADQPAVDKPERSGDILKALMAGLSAWSRKADGKLAEDAAPDFNPLDMGTLFEFGMAYVQAKQRGGTRLQVLADAACSVSPLSRTPHRAESGRIAIQALLQAMQI